jgi:dephospho-CoA kinase
VSRGERRYSRQFRPEFSRLYRDHDLRWVVPFSVRYVIGVTGARFAGKSAALVYMADKRGFEMYSLGETLREIAVRLGVPLEPRYRLQDLGDELRAHFDDPAYLARITLRRIHRDHLDQRGTTEPLHRIAVGGFKRLEELQLFETLERFAHFSIVAPQQVRFERALSSGIMERELRHLEPRPKLDLPTFREHIERRDMNGRDDPWTGTYGQAVAKLTDVPSAITIDNGGTYAALDQVLDHAIGKLDRSYRAFSA